LVIGGSADLVLPLLKSQDEPINLLNLNSELDVKEKYLMKIPLEEPKLNEHNRSYFRMIYEDSNINKNISNIVHFGLQGHKVRQEDID
jgi:hypothetical protein